MKTIKIFAFIVSTILTMSCSSYNYHELGIDEKLWKFANQIIANPTKIDSIKILYPEYYNENYINKYYFDSVSTDSYIKFIIENELSEKVADARITLHGFTNEDLIYIREHIRNQEISLDQLFGFFVTWGKLAVQFDFVKTDNKFYLCSIHEVIFPW